jgi:hypothetical protein
MGNSKLVIDWANRKIQVEILGLGSIIKAIEIYKVCLIGFHFPHQQGVQSVGRWFIKVGSSPS